MPEPSDSGLVRPLQIAVTTARELAAPDGDTTPPRLVAVLCRSDAAPDDDAAAVLARWGIAADTLLERGDVSAEAAAVSDVTPADRRSDPIVVLGVGLADTGTLRRAGAVLARRARARTPRPSTLAVVVGALASEGVRALVEGILLGDYRPARRGVSAAEDGVRLETVILIGATDARRRADVAAAVASARASRLARDLANAPGDVKDPQWLADRAVDVATEANVRVRVRDERELLAEGFGGILAVGSGSARPPRFVELTYEPARPLARGPHVVLVGKGITFDSGGLSLKPREAMVPMKTDMSGAAAVLGAMSGLRARDVRVWVTGLLAIAENLPSGSAMRPGDVIRHFGGATSEVVNTDAEGRLVLADALAYADAVLDPDAVVDIATLTGAASLALGRRHGALFTADDRLAAALSAAGDSAGERLWRMPLTADYAGDLASEVADLRHTAVSPPRAGGTAGATTAALFLQAFVGRRLWAHLDVAGPARAEADDADISKGATGFGARVLLRWLSSPALR